MGAFIPDFQKRAVHIERRLFQGTRAYFSLLFTSTAKIKF